MLVETPKRKKQESQAEKGFKKEEKHCYPRRNIVRRDYTEMEVPDDDHYICEFTSGCILCVCVAICTLCKCKSIDNGSDYK